MTAAVSLSVYSSNNLNIQSCVDSAELTQYCYDWLISSVKETGAKRVFLPAGSTPISLYKMLEEKKPKELNSVTFVQVDEVVTGSQRGVFRRFFEEHLPSYAGQFEFLSDDIELNGRGADVDLAILGIGLNGHVAFHEPGMESSFDFGIVDLSDETIKNLRLEPSARGRTYGLAAFMKTKKVLMISKGQSKAIITAQLVCGGYDIPAGQLSMHPDFTLAADTDALSIIEAEGCPIMAIA
jgi:glucosamine-6-phosphate deaminase